MATYEVFDSLGILVKVTDADLEQARSSSAPLTVELMNAAAMSQFQSLENKIRERLESANKTEQMVAALSLLSFNSTSSIDLLDSLAQSVPNRIVSNVFKSVALRLRGLKCMRSSFFNNEAQDDLPSFIISNYNSFLLPSDEDFCFLFDALIEYNTKSLPWIRNLSKESILSDIETILLFLNNNKHTNKLSQYNFSKKEQSKSIKAIKSTMEQYKNRDIQKLCKQLLKRIESIQPDPSLSPH